MPKFRKKPVVIEAKQWWPPGDPRHDPSMLVHRRGHTVDPPDYVQPGDLFQFSKTACDGHIFLVATLEGHHEVSPGDWIITGVMGEKYPCKPDIFELTYEPVEES
jgi:hypothetical protein